MTTAWRRITAWFFVCTLAGGCDLVARPEKVAAADQFARSTIEILRLQGVEGVRPRLTRETASEPGMRDALGRMQTLLPPGPPDSIRLVAGNFSLNGGVTLYKLSYLVHKAALASQVDIWVEEKHGQMAVNTIHVLKLR